MKRSHRIGAAGLIGVNAALLSGLAFADHGGPLHSLFNSRGTLAGSHIDVAIVGAQLEPGAQTGWHTHPSDSIVTVQPGGPALRMVTRHHGRCVERSFAAGQAFVHPAGPHNFINSESGRPLTFGVAYVVPTGVILLTPATAPAVCG